MAVPQSGPSLGGHLKVHLARFVHRLSVGPGETKRYRATEILSNDLTLHSFRNSREGLGDKKHSPPFWKKMVGVHMCMQLLGLPVQDG